jgi:restriction endonuclease S subunit
MRPLKELVSQFLVPMRDKPKVFDGDIPWCRIEDIEGNFIHGSKSGKMVSKEIIEDMNLVVFPKNTVIVSCSARMGICAITTTPLVTNQTFIGLVCGPELNQRYLLHYMNASKQRLEHMATGATVRYLSRKKFENFLIAAPSINEQKRIVALLDKTDAIKNQSEQTKPLRKQLIHSLFLDMFGDPRIPVSGEKISEFAHVESGNGFPLKYQGETNNEIPFYKVSDMNLSGNEKYMLFHNNSVTTQTVEKLKLRIFPAGSVIFPKIGAAIATNKKRITTMPCCVDNNVIGIIPNLSIDSEYLHTLLQFKDISEFASSSSPPSMRKTTVESWIIPNIEFEKQIEFKDALLQIEKNKFLTSEFETLRDSLTQEMLT